MTDSRSRGGPAKRPGRLRALFSPGDHDSGLVAAAPTVPPRELLRRFWPFARPYRRIIAAGMLFVLIELMDNGDGTLSLIGTVLDTAAPVAAPPPGTPAAGMTDAELGSVSRLLAANVRGGLARASAGRTPAGNVELPLRDPRRPR